MRLDCLRFHIFELNTALIAKHIKSGLLHLVNRVDSSASMLNCFDVVIYFPHLYKYLFSFTERHADI